MAGKRDISWISDQIVTILKADLPAKLTAYYSEYTDPIILTAPDETNYHIAQRRLIDGYPMVCVIPDRTETQPLSGEANYFIEYHYLTIAVALTLNDGEDDLKRRASRTIRAIRSLLKSHFTIDGSAVEMLPISEQYGPMMVGEDALLQEAQVTVRAITDAAA
jgi:hypothetical protein